jgi:hypothetical protein
MIADEDRITCAAAESFVVLAVVVAALHGSIVRFVKLVARFFDIGI